MTLDGKPLASGLIYFKTIQTGAVDSAEIKDGKFEGKAQPATGAWRSAPMRRSSRGGRSDGYGDPEEYPSPRYHLESSLTAKVTQEGPNEFNFELVR